MGRGQNDSSTQTGAEVPGSSFGARKMGTDLRSRMWEDRRTS